MTLTNLIIKSYSSILVTIGSAALFFFMLGSYLIIRLSRGKVVAVIEDDDEAAAPVQAAAPAAASTVKRTRRMPASEKAILSEALNDVSAISGEDPIATQLDLAKAYIESDKAQLAKIILASVIREGHPNYQEEAQRLLSTI